MVLSLGGTAGTYSISLYGWSIPFQEFLDARTYIIPIGNSTVKFTINSDNTFNYDHNGTNIPLKEIALYND